jgi:hypothetical protein
MASSLLTHTHKGLGFATLALGALTVVGFAAMLGNGDLMQAWVVRRTAEPTWKILDEEQVMSGATIPADTHVLFHIPLSVERIDREVLLGGKGKDVRYWGYCLPENAPPEIVARRTGFPGLIFLSEREREVRAAANYKAVKSFSLTNLPTKEELEASTKRTVGVIRHQIDVFTGGQLCYVMTEEPLAIGIDPDQDRVNTKVERAYGSDPEKPDTDGDGILDGIELKTDTDMLHRDTDGDGILDGIEDANWNGEPDAGETDPRVKDSDRDGLCDGLCRMRLSNGQVLYNGEDKNLNGTVDEGETNPLKVDSDGDGTHDLEEYLVCLTQGKRVCK